MTTIFVPYVSPPTPSDDGYIPRLMGMDGNHEIERDDYDYAQTVSHSFNTTAYLPENSRAQWHDISARQVIHRNAMTAAFQPGTFQPDAFQTGNVDATALPDYQQIHARLVAHIEALAELIQVRPSDKQQPLTAEQVALILHEMEKLRQQNPPIENVKEAAWTLQWYREVLRTCAVCWVGDKILDELFQRLGEIIALAWYYVEAMEKLSQMTGL